MAARWMGCASVLPICAEASSGLCRSRNCIHHITIRDTHVYRITCLQCLELPCSRSVVGGRGAIPVAHHTLHVIHHVGILGMHAKVEALLDQKADDGDVVVARGKVQGCIEGISVDGSNGMALRRTCCAKAVDSVHVRGVLAFGQQTCLCPGKTRGMPILRYVQQRPWPCVRVSSIHV